ncbi:MAG: DUF2155 domain-containing protein [Nitrospirota bacterium]
MRFMKNMLNISMSVVLVMVISACSDKPSPAPEVSINTETLAKQKTEALRSNNQSADSDKGHEGHAHNDSNETAAPNSRPEGHASAEKHQTEIVVPDNVKGKWEAVKLSITDKKNSKTQTATVKLGSEYKIPDSSMTVKPDVFLPDFRMDSLTITSVSAELNNPAVNVIISDSGKELFKGWLYSKYPDVHPFQHDRYAIVMVEAVMAEGPQK